ncbi:MAG: porin family protein, partial [Bacteroidetes bacterium]|nr:porin family protein [Bacteroidota bacterium]
MRTFLPLFLSVFIAASASTFAQRNDIENTFGVGPLVGWYSSNDAEEGAMFFGMLGRLRLGNNVGFEASLSYRDAEVFHTGQIDLNNLTADVTYVPITFSFMIFAPVGSFLTPYATAGIGFYYTIEAYDVTKVAARDIRALLEDEENFVTGYHFGLGLEIPFSTNIALHGEFRYLFLGSKITSIRDVQTLDTDTKNSDGIMFSGGLMVYL